MLTQKTFHRHSRRNHMVQPSNLLLISNSNRWRWTIPTNRDVDRANNSGHVQDEHRATATTSDWMIDMFEVCGLSYEGVGLDRQGFEPCDEPVWILGRKYDTTTSKHLLSQPVGVHTSLDVFFVRLFFYPHRSSSSPALRANSEGPPWFSWSCRWNVLTMFVKKLYQ